VDGTMNVSSDSGDDTPLQMALSRPHVVRRHSENKAKNRVSQPDESSTTIMGQLSSISVVGKLGLMTNDWYGLTDDQLVSILTLFKDRR
jgi:hypothetical protein